MTPRHPDLHRHGGLPRSTLRHWLQRQHYAQACRSDTKFPKGNIEEPLRPSWYLVRSSRLRDERAPIILGRPFLNTSGAVIYTSAAKISFYIKGRKETFTFKNKTTQILEQSQHEPKKRTNRRNKNKQMCTE